MIRSVRWGAALGSLFLASSIHAAVLTFEDLSLGGPGDGSTEYNATGKYYWNGSNLAGGFTTGGATFNNTYDDTFGPYWEKFAYSNTTDVSTPGYTNQYSAYPGSGAGGSSNYVVGFQPYFGEFGLNFSTPQDFAGLSVDITNTTYAALSMLNGAPPAKKFGGVSGDDADWFLLTITGWNGATQAGTVEFYLADYRFADNSLDYIVDDWTSVDLSSLGSGIDKLTFGLTSSDNSDFGMNTPAYFALDNLEVSSVPEPSTYALLFLGLSIVGIAARRQLAKA